MSRELLSDESVDRYLPMSDAIEVTKQIFRYHAEGSLLFDPRFSFDTGIGSLKFTAGAVDDLLIIGSRISGKFPERPNESVDFDVETPVKADMYVVFDVEKGRPFGAIEGSRLADVRTGAIGGVALDRMAPEDVSTLCVIGSGRMARTQLEAATAVRDFESIRIYSRTRANREAFAGEMRELIGEHVEAVNSAESAVRDAEIVVTATSSPQPVIDVSWLHPNAHVNVVGPLFDDAHEVDTELFDVADEVVTDSLDQIDAYGEKYLLHGTEHRGEMIELKAIIDEPEPFRSDPGVTVFCPIGLPGTEVVLAHEVLVRASNDADV